MSARFAPKPRPIAELVRLSLRVSGWTASGRARAPGAVHVRARAEGCRVEVPAAWTYARAAEVWLHIAELVELHELAARSDGEHAMLLAPSGAEGFGDWVEATAA